MRLPPPRCRSAIEMCFVPMRDGVRLATWHVWPIDIDRTPGTIVIRTPYGVGGPRSLIGLTSRLLAESGHHVIVQDVRGRYASEGRFVPFLSEQRDGGDTLRWVADQPWSNGPVGLFGASYLAYTAWCALAEAPEHVGALVSVIGSADLYGVFHGGGALALQNTLEWGAGVGEQESVPARRIDIDRGLSHRPVREADRVALRTVDWVRDWIDHPRHDSYWKEIAAELPARIPPVLSIAGAYDFFLSDQLREHAAVEAAVGERGGVGPRLVVGPWAHGVPARLGFWRESLAGHALREAIAHFDEHLLGERPRAAASAVRYFLPGPDAWQDAAQWPPAGAMQRRLFLGMRDGECEVTLGEPGDEQATRHFRHDPERPTPSIGGALFGLKAGIKDQRPLETRRDVATYQSAPLAHDLTLTGPVRASIHLATDGEDLDLAVKLIDVAPDGRAENVCDGIQRARWRDAAQHDGTPSFIAPNVVTRIDVDLGNAVRTFRAGHAVRIVLAGSSFPRFDRNPGCRVSPALATPDEFRVTEQTVHHDAAHRSWVDVSVRDSAGLVD